MGPLGDHQSLGFCKKLFSLRPPILSGNAQIQMSGDLSSFLLNSCFDCHHLLVATRRRVEWNCLIWCHKNKWGKHKLILQFWIKCRLRSACIQSYRLSLSINSSSRTESNLANRFRRRNEKIQIHLKCVIVSTKSAVCGSVDLDKLSLLVLRPYKV